VIDGRTYFSEEKRDARSETSQVAPGVPAYQIRNTAVDGLYRIEKEVLTDPWRDVVLQRVRFVPLQGTLADFRLYVILAPHLSNRGSGNTAWVGDYKATPMLLAERDNFALALASSAPWLARSVGFVGVSDGWQQLQAELGRTRAWCWPAASRIRSRARGRTPACWASKRPRCSRASGRRPRSPRICSPQICSCRRDRAARTRR
jgi:GH15 family glucan-1,4-alpha-glucosidase